MAKVKRIEVKPEPPPPEVQLTLTLEEAQLIQTLLGQVSGKTSWGKLNSDIYWAMNDAGVHKPSGINVVNENDKLVTLSFTGVK